jgi:hypothetical protein
MMKLCTLLSVYLVLASSSAFAPPAHTTTTSQVSSRTQASTVETRLHAEPQQSRAAFFKGALASFLVAAPQIASASSIEESPSSLFVAKAYSSNARNMDRISAGDFSGGSVYDNNPSSAGARRRRAMQGCKIPSAREEAAEGLHVKNLGEKDCNVKVMSESPDFMLQAMQTLDCPMCPYGIKESR